MPKVIHHQLLLLVKLFFCWCFRFLWSCCFRPSPDVGLLVTPLAGSVTLVVLWTEWGSADLSGSYPEAADAWVVLTSLVGRLPGQPELLDHWRHLAALYGWVVLLQLSGVQLLGIGNY